MSHLEDQASSPLLDESGRFPKRNRNRLIITLVVILLAFETGGYMIPGPMTRIIESIACRKYWAVHDPSQIPANGQVAEKLCKIPAVQTEVTTVKGYSDFWEELCSTLFAIPYSLLADRYGRKTLICLTIPGFILNGIITNSVLWFSNILPLRGIWFAALAWAVGGGPTMAMAIVWTMIADVTTNSQRAIIFSRVGVLSMAVSFLSRAISSGLMTVQPWIPMLIGCGLVLVALSLILSLPETLGDSPDEISPVDSDVEMPHSEASSSGEPSFDDMHFIPKSSWWIALHDRCRQMMSPFSFIFHRRVLLLLSTFLIYHFNGSSTFFLVQYISTRFAWPLARANFLISFQPAITIPVFLFLIPYLSKWHLHHLSPATRDLYLARMSILVLTLGTLGISLAPSMIILIPSVFLQAAGSGLLFISRSLITGLVSQDETARLYTVIQVLQSIGSMTGNLSLTNLLPLGLAMGGGWIGLAWMVNTLLFSILGISLGMFRLPPVSER
ncbi:putative MFS transporter [Aspergillus coremiiformis]|uniref:Putative MFS transporter n=1 Tax=Aspergillus coremiiformis TaxID=138285 RepID=A0A5N6ZDU7_9EURO|nr:putative MFS transporter [Aspergillus coremiiformis]